MVDFKKEISFGKKSEATIGKKTGIYPTKTKINLVGSDRKQGNRMITVILFIVFIVLLALFTKYAIIDPLALADASNRRVQLAQERLDELKDQNRSMSELGDQYAKYVAAGMTPEESELVNRNEVVDLLRSKVMGVSVLSSVKISDNMITVTCQGLSLQDASVVVHDLEQDERVSHVTVSTAQERDGSAASATFEIMLKSATELAEQRDSQQNTTSSGTQDSTEEGAENGE